MVHVNSQFTDDHVEDLWRGNDESEYHQVVAALNEATYKKTKQPLGRSCNRGHKLPTYMRDDSYRHGVKTCESNEDAKRLIYPLGSAAENSNELLHQPGLQKRRNYNWPVDVDPVTTTFGVKGEIVTMARGDSIGVASALQFNDCGVDTTEQTGSAVDEDQVFGKSTCQGCYSASDCLAHVDINEVSEVVDDLGKSLTPGFRNIETSRSFGIPSIRNDIPKYERSSVADMQNYGDDCNAAYLLRPSLFSSLGLEEDEFDKPRTREFLRKLVMNCGVLQDSIDFNSIFEQVADEADEASIKSFLGKVCER